MYEIRAGLLAKAQGQRLREEMEGVGLQFGGRSNGAKSRIEAEERQESKLLLICTTGEMVMSFTEKEKLRNSSRERVKCSVLYM